MISPQSIAQLNDHYTVTDAIKFEQGEGGLSRAVLTGQGATAHVYTLGAHVCEFVSQLCPAMRKRPYLNMHANLHQICAFL